MRFVLFVCTGNSCRSVMAQAICEQLLRERRLYGDDPNNVGEAARRIFVLSAGIAALEGMTPTFETRSIVRNAGMNVGAHRAKRLTDDMIHQAELIFVMERMHRDAIVERQPEAADKTFMLRAFGMEHEGGANDSSIMDPIGKPLEVYEVCFATIKASVERVVRHLESTCESR